MSDHKLQTLTVSNFIACDFENDKELMNIIDLASVLTNIPIAGISILDEDNLYLKKGKGIPVCSFPRELSFCTHTVMQNDVMIINDTLKDKRFADNPYVNGDIAAIRFYAGVPLIKNDGEKVGAICVIDTKENDLSIQMQLTLKLLANQVIKIIELRVSTMLLDVKNEELKKQSQINQVTNTRLRSFVDSTTNFHVFLGIHGEIIDFNKTAYNFIRSVLHDEIIIGEKFAKYIQDEFLVDFHKNLRFALLGEKKVFEGYNYHESAGIIWWETTFEPVKNTNDEIIGVSYFAFNISEQKHKEKKILTQNRSLMRIAHIQAHEFRGPLTTIMSLVDLMNVEKFNTYEYLPLLTKAVALLDQSINSVINNIEEAYSVP